jgi:hypothetical protein
MLSERLESVHSSFVGCSWLTHRRVVSGAGGAGMGAEQSTETNPNQPQRMCYGGRPDRDDLHVCVYCHEVQLQLQLPPTHVLLSFVLVCTGLVST